MKKRVKEQRKYLGLKETKGREREENEWDQVTEEEEEEVMVALSKEMQCLLLLWGFRRRRAIVFCSYVFLEPKAIRVLLIKKKKKKIVDLPFYLNHILVGQFLATHEEILFLWPIGTVSMKSNMGFENINLKCCVWA
jgi:hypothetical protein